MITFYIYGKNDKQISVAHVNDKGDRILWEHELLCQIVQFRCMFNTHTDEQDNWTYRIDDVKDFYNHFKQSYTAKVTLEASINANSRKEAAAHLKDELLTKLIDTDLWITKVNEKEVDKF